MGNTELAKYLDELVRDLRHLSSLQVRGREEREGADDGARQLSLDAGPAHRRDRPRVVTLLLLPSEPTLWRL